MLKSFRYFLLPVSLIYGLIIKIRNWLFNKNILKSAQFNFPIICVGNLATGGTGKTPMTEYLIEMLQDDFKVATLSRGYKRKTKGFTVANDTTTALDIGDEPMQFHQKYKNVVVAVGEERIVAVPHLLQEKPDTQVIILDDAFQHRRIRAGLNIVLTDYSNLYTRDFPLPAGDLRDVRSSAKRAHIIIVTKCPAALEETEQQKIVSEINPAPHQSVFFTTLSYGQPTHLFSEESIADFGKMQCIVVCGIANPAALKSYLHEHTTGFEMMEFRDHHIFKIDDLKDIQKSFGKLEGEDKIILTTEKDAVRLLKFENELKGIPIYALPVKHQFLFGDGAVFEQKIKLFIQDFKL